MLPDRVPNPGPLTYESGALPIALRGPASKIRKGSNSVNTGDTVMLVHSAIFLRFLYQCIKFHLIPLYTFRDMHRTNVLLQKGSNSVNTVDWVIVLVLCHFPHRPLFVYQVSLNYLKNICSRQKCDGRSDGQSTKYILSLREA